MGVIARQSIKGALANYLGVAIGFVVSFFVVTRYLTTEEVGLTRVMVDVAILFSSLAQMGTNSSIVRFFPYFKDDRNNHGVFGLSLLLPLAGFLLVALLFFVFREPLIEIYAEKSPLVADYFYLLPMLTFFMLYLTVFETNASVLMRITVPKLVREVWLRLFNLAAYLLYGFHVIGLDAFVWMFCGSYGLAMMLNLFYLMKLNHFRWSTLKVEWRFLTRERRREIGRYTLFMTITVLAGNVPYINSLFLGAKAGLALTGVYTIAFYIANVVEVPYRSLGAISRPVVAAAVKDNNWGEVNRLVRQVSLHQLLVACFIFLLIWINLDTLYLFIPNGASYAGGTGVVLMMGLAKVVNSSFSMSVDVLNFSRYYSRSLLFIAVLTASAIALNAWLIGVWSITGAAAATLFSYLLYYLLLQGYLYWRTRVNLLSLAQLKVVALIAGGFALNLLWSAVVTPLFDGSQYTLLLDAALKTVVLSALLLAGTYRWKVSPTVNQMIDTLSLRIRKRI
ncbi:MAG: lipopolysaccharide biosynthesis protein [Bacteroidales bacterium]|nr:lipopolysaccharide biosynthesis protein [Bacteroidales bacterium]